MLSLKKCKPTPPVELNVKFSLPPIHKQPIHKQPIHKVAPVRPIKHITPKPHPQPQPQPQPHPSLTCKVQDGYIINPSEFAEKLGTQSFNNCLTGCKAKGYKSFQFNDKKGKTDNSINSFCGCLANDGNTYKTTKRATTNEAIFSTNCNSVESFINPFKHELFTTNGEFFTNY